MLVVVDTVHVLVTVVKSTVAHKVDTIILKPLMYKQVGSILSVLVVYIVAVKEIVLDVLVVHLTLMDVI